MNTYEGLQVGYRLIGGMQEYKKVVETKSERRGTEEQYGRGIQGVPTGAS